MGTALKGQKPQLRKTACLRAKMLKTSWRWRAQQWAAAAKALNRAPLENTFPPPPFAAQPSPVNSASRSCRH